MHGLRDHEHELIDVAILASPLVSELPKAASSQCAGLIILAYPARPPLYDSA